MEKNKLSRESLNARIAEAVASGDVAAMRLADDILLREEKHTKRFQRPPGKRAAAAAAAKAVGESSVWSDDLKG